MRLFRKPRRIVCRCCGQRASDRRFIVLIRAKVRDEEGYVKLNGPQLRALTRSVCADCADRLFEKCLAEVALYERS